MLYEQAGEVVAERWKVVEKIGEGTFSQIYLAFSLSDNRRVAVKVEAPSALKPVLEWESSILKSLQDCDHVCRYLYHGKHAESTVLVMELLGESMSMLRVSPDAIHGVPLARCVAVGLEVRFAGYYGKMWGVCMVIYLLWGCRPDAGLHRGVPPARIRAPRHQSV